MLLRDEKTLEGKLTLLFDRERGLEISLEDKNSGINVIDVELSPDLLATLLSRQCSVKCDYSLIKDTTNIGKYQEYETHEFQLPDDTEYHDEKVARRIAAATCPEGWIPDLYFSSQDSFFYKDKPDALHREKWARCTIRRYVDEPSEGND